MRCLTINTIASIFVLLAAADSATEPVEKVAKAPEDRELVLTASQTGYGSSSGFGDINFGSASQASYSGNSVPSGSSLGADNTNGNTVGLFGVAGGEWIVYILGAFFTVIFAFYYKAHVVDVIIRENNKQPLQEFQLNHEPYQHDDFDVGLCECLGEPCMVFRLICPCTAVVRQAHTMSVVSALNGRGPLCDYWAVIGLYLCGGMCCCLPNLCLTMYFRHLLKEKMHLDDHIVNDFCLSWLCSPCTVGQMALVVDRELEYEMHFCCELQWDEPASKAYDLDYRH
jgi:Cys-rich protein (TIGR01571 family)